ncbi:MAG TPA: hypothetical protein VIL49_09015 [Capillimicrobium sp.]|jgi:hypothetical protein
MTAIDAAADFLRTHARLLDRRRFALHFADGDAQGVLDALTAYRNPDGGFGWGLEPDLRAPGSQPAGALHAFEALAEAAPATSDMAPALCDWLGTVTLADGGLPFALAGAAGAGTAPWWAGADPSASSLHITAAICEQAHLLARHDAAVASHPWLQRATDFCARAIAARPVGGPAYELRFVLGLLDALGDREPWAPRELDRHVAAVPASATLPVEGGVEGEVLRPLALSPRAEGPLRERLDATAIAADLDRTAAEQRDDGGWEVDFPAQSPAAGLEWRGYATVGALKALAGAGRLDAAS